MSFAVNFINGCRHDPYSYVTALGVKQWGRLNVAFSTSNVIALIFLESQADLQEAVAGLNVHRVAGGILYGHDLTASGFGGSATDPAVLDIII